MPVVLPDGLEEAWLQPADGAALRALEPLLEPRDAGREWQIERAEPRRGSRMTVGQLALFPS